jgi:mxaJ protein
LWRGPSGLNARLGGLRYVVALLAVCAQAATLRVCADPDNLPFSNQAQEGFENRIAQRLARDLGMELEFVWWAGRQSVVKNTLNAGRCDLLMGVPPAADSVTATQPYYRSTYVFVTRQEAAPIKSLNDPRLAKMRIGIQMLGDDYAPPSIALGRRGMAANIVGYRHPAVSMIHAVAAGDIDVAIAWGPLGGYFARRETPRLQVTPVSPQSYLTVPFVYDMAIGLRKGNDELRAQLDAALQRSCTDIQDILRDYGVPQVNGRGPCVLSQRSSASLR